MANIKAGIAVRDTLKSLFFSAGDNGIRFIKVQLSDDCEYLVESGTKAVQGSWEQDFALVPPELEDKTACFILYRTDNVTENRHQWYMLCYVPDTAPVRQKMLYASTRHPLKNELGAKNFLDEVHGTDRKDFTPEGFEEYKRHITSEAPLTQEEILKKEERQSGISEAVGMGSPVAYSHGVSFPIDEAVDTAFDDMRSGHLNYIQLTIDLDAEVVKVAKTGNFSPEDAAVQIPPTDCAFHYFNWIHQHEGQEIASLVFAFSCPDGSSGTKGAPVKQRMLYASSKANAIAIPASRGFEVACKLEVASSKDFGVDDYSVVIHPPVEEEKKTFKKPAAPRGRRMVGK